ncbi:MAG: AraC family transcriptional regulator, partial [Lentisphaeria bacterium]|nr:AraC family transcriptional regulator [Lentisphaeria bacterium]
EIARAFGYMDPFHFSRRFKEIMGIAPKFYRRQTH